MAVELFLIPSLQSAQRHLAGQLEDLKRNDPAAPAIILVPTGDAGGHLGYRLGNSLNISIYRFADLSREIVNHSGQSVGRANLLTVERLVTHLLEDMASKSELTTFEAVYKKPGFIKAAIGWLREMKLQDIKPGDVEREAGDSGRKRDRQLAILYHHYQEFLGKRHLDDDPGLISLAAGSIEQDPTIKLNSDVLFVIGFDNFYPLDLRLFRHLSKIVPKVIIYLPWSKEQPADGLAMTRINHTRLQLDSSLAPEIYFADDDTNGPLLLKTISDNLFTNGSSKPLLEFVDGELRSLSAIAAPSREMEVRQALRGIKELLLKGINPREVALLTPQPDVYRPLVRAIASEYEVAVDVGASLETNPAASALINLLELGPTFPWRETFDALRSPYFRQPELTDEQLVLLEQLTRERPVVSGRDQWEYALTPPEIPEDNLNALRALKRLLVVRESKEELEAIKNGLWSFFEIISPKKRKSYSEHTAWLQEFIFGIEQVSSSDALEDNSSKSSLNMVECCREGESVREDLEAVAEVLSAIGQLISAADLIPSGTGTLISWDIFRRDVIESIKARKVPQDPGTPAVKFSNMPAVRSLSADYIFVLGLAEGEFPRRPKSDPFYSQLERANSRLPLKIEDLTEDAGLWWQTISNCGRQLTIIRPWLDENGVPWLPSPYWRTVVGQLPNSTESKLQMDSLPEFEGAASRAELLLALAEAEAKEVPTELTEQWVGVNRAQEVIKKRSGWNPPGVYEGALTSVDLVKELSQNFGSSHIWSPSRLNRYGNCPYGFFAEQILNFQIKTDPEEGFDAMQRGSLIHEVLESLYKQLRSEELPPTLTNQSNVLEILEVVCDRIFSWAPQRYDFRPGPLWDYEQQELRRILRAFVSWDCEQNQGKAFYKPRYLELFFGFPGSDHGILTFEDADNLRVKVHGVIDRVDVNDEGQSVVIDYKSGGGIFSKSDISQGLAFQTPLYALAVEQLFSEISEVVASKYLHIPTRKDSGVLKFSSPVSEDESVQAAINRAGAFVHNVRHGFFPSAPGKPSVGSGLCRNQCEFAAICRVTRTSIAKIRQL